MDTLVDLLTGTSPYNLELRTFGQAFQGAMTVRNGPNKDKSMPWFYAYCCSLLTAFAGGLFGFMWMKTLFDPGAGMNLPQSTIFILVGWLFFCMTPMAKDMGLNVANWAHAVGIIVGIIAGMMPRSR